MAANIFLSNRVKKAIDRISGSIIGKNLNQFKSIFSIKNKKRNLNRIKIIINNFNINLKAKLDIFLYKKEFNFIIIYNYILILFKLEKLINLI
jgi:hypothetical protein